MIAPLAAHFLISLMLVVRAVSSTAQWKTLRVVDIGEGIGTPHLVLDGARWVDESFPTPRNTVGYTAVTK